MRTRKFTACVVALFAVISSVAPAMAQYYPHPQHPQRPYYGPGPGYGGHGYGPRFDGQEYYSPRQRVVVGNICDTPRGACQTQPMPAGSGCRCKIPGFGKKRGVIIAPGW